MGQCENQLYPTAEYPTAEYPKRVAYLKYKDLKSGLEYCQYGKVLNADDVPTDCQPVPVDKLWKDFSTDLRCWPSAFAPQALHATA